MSAGKFIGRVGGLAFALGIGAAAYSGTAVAWADSPSSGPSSHASASGSGASSGSGHAATRGGTHATAPNRSRLTALPSAVTEPAASDPLPSGTPDVPIDSPLDLAPLAYSRRGTAAVAPSAPAAAQSAAPVLPEAPEADVQAAATENVALIMGPSGVPIPTQEYINNVFLKYVVPNSPDGTVKEELVTPEGLYPITGVKSLPLNISVDQGNQILYDEVLKQLNAGNSVTVFGYSQSAIISSLVMGPDNTGCVNTPTCSIPADAPVNFVLVGNEMNPNGGFLSRFPGLNLPSLGIPFYGPTPEDAFSTANYTLEYDGFADFPQYPFNAISVLNAGLGIVFVHTQYSKLTPAQLGAAIALPTSCGTDPCSTTQKYYIIPTENLPLLEPVRLIPVIGNALADLWQPALKVIVNMGYGDPNYGWSNEGYANQLTSFGIFPKVNWVEVAQLFVAGVVQGLHDFIDDFSPGGIVSQEIYALFHPTPSPPKPHPPHPMPDSIISAIQMVTTGVGEFISNAAASVYAALLPTADIVNAFITMLPTYDINLFLDGVQQVLSGDILGGLVNAIGLPIAADVGLVTLSALIEVLVIGQAVLGIFEGVQ